EVVGRPEDHLPVALLEPAAVEADEGGGFPELRGGDEAHGTRSRRSPLLGARGEGGGEGGEAVPAAPGGGGGGWAGSGGRGAQGGREGAARALRMVASASPVGVSLLSSATAMPRSVKKRSARAMPCQSGADASHIAFCQGVRPKNASSSAGRSATMRHSSS